MQPVVESVECFDGQVFPCCDFAVCAHAVDDGVVMFGGAFAEVERRYLFGHPVEQGCGRDFGCAVEFALNRLDVDDVSSVYASVDFGVGALGEDEESGVEFFCVWTVDDGARNYFIFFRRNACIDVIGFAIMDKSEFNRAFLIGFCSVAVVENNGTRDWHFSVCF